MWYLGGLHLFGSCAFRTTFQGSNSAPMAGETPTDQALGKGTHVQEPLGVGGFPTTTHSAMQNAQAKLVSLPDPGCTENRSELFLKTLGRKPSNLKHFGSGCINAAAFFAAASTACQVLSKLFGEQCLLPGVHSLRDRGRGGRQ